MDTNKQLETTRLCKQWDGRSFVFTGWCHTSRSGTLDASFTGASIPLLTLLVKSKSSYRIMSICSATHHNVTCGNTGDSIRLAFGFFFAQTSQRAYFERLP
jgi:hypothetical protein